MLPDSSGLRSPPPVPTHIPLKSTLPSGVRGVAAFPLLAPCCIVASAAVSQTVAARAAAMLVRVRIRRSMMTAVLLRSSVIERVRRILVEQGDDLAVRTLHRAHASDVGPVLRGRERHLVRLADLEDAHEAGGAQRLRACTRHLPRH